MKKIGKGQRGRHWAIQKEWLRSLSLGDLPNSVTIGRYTHTDVARYLTKLQKTVKKSKGYDAKINEEINQLQRAVIWKTQNR